VPDPAADRVKGRSRIRDLRSGRTTTMTLISPIQSLTHMDAIRTRWTEADAGLWVADADGVFGGSIDHDVDGYIARDPFGRERGTFTGLAEAQAALETFLAHPAMSRYVRGARASAH
jgi:hypothetical protein